MCRDIHAALHARYDLTLSHRSGPLAPIACMLMCMIEIDSIHAFEDEVFLETITRWSVAVMGIGVIAVLFMAARAGSMGTSAEAAVFRCASDVWGLFGAAVALILLVALLTVLSLMIHEGVHALCFKLFAPKGAHVYFGAQWDKGMFYACAEGIVFSRRHYMVAVLAPSVAVTALCATLGAMSNCPLLAALVAVLHLSGCTGDWFYARRIATDGAILACEDTAWGVRFLGEGPVEGEGEVA